MIKALKKTLKQYQKLSFLSIKSDWKEIDFPPQPSKDWKKFELNNKAVVS